MTKRITLLILLVAFLAVDANAQNRKYRRRGALLGGLAGAAIGAAIGDKGDNETAGALIGGAVGAVAGGTIGNQKDRRIEHNYRYHSGYRSSGHYNPVVPYGQTTHGPYPHYNQPYHSPHLQSYPSGTIVTPTPAVPPAPPIDPASPDAPVGQAPQKLTPQDVAEMVQGGLSESMIIQQIEFQGVRNQLAVSDVIRLHQLGVSETIITAMQKAALVGETVVQPNQSYRIPVPPQQESFGPSILRPVE